MNAIPIKSYLELPNAPCAMFMGEDEEVIKKKCRKLFNREPETIYVHRTGTFVPVSVQEYQANAVSIAIYVPENRP